MKYFKCQVGFEPDTIERINEFAIVNNIKTFSKSVRTIIDIGLKYLTLEKYLRQYEEKLDKTNAKLNYTNKLIKQLYSDLELEFHTNIKNNQELKKIDSNIFRSNIDK